MEAGAAAAVGLPWWLATRAYFKIWHRLEVTGRDNLPETPRFIFAANHTSHLDVVLVWSSLPTEVRRLTKVVLEDAVKADDMFTILMGDELPRGSDGIVVDAVAVERVVVNVPLLKQSEFSLQALFLIRA